MLASEETRCIRWCAVEGLGVRYMDLNRASWEVRLRCYNTSDKFTVDSGQATCRHS